MRKKTKSEEFGFQKYIEHVLPDKYVMEAINLIDDLIKRNFIIIDENYKMYFKDDDNKSLMKVDLDIVLRGIFIKNASIVKYKDFFSKLLNYLNVDIIKNSKLLTLIRENRGFGIVNKFWLYSR